MPEGPEVELVRRGLQPLLNQAITGILLSTRKKYQNQALMFQNILHERIISVIRKGKWLVFKFSNNMGALHHLGMTGNWRLHDLKSHDHAQHYVSTILKILPSQKVNNNLHIINFRQLTSSQQTKTSTHKQNLGITKTKRKPQKTQTGVPIKKSFIQHKPAQQSFQATTQNKKSGTLLFTPHDKLVFLLDHGIIAVFNDIRTFGYFNLYEKYDDVLQLQQLRNLGPDVLETPFPINEFKNRLLKHPTLTIAKALLNPKILAGCGNIYRSEALYESKINPFTEIKNLTKNDIIRLGHAVSTITTQALNLGGATIKDYHDPTGKTGQMQETFKVYGRAMQLCLTCGSVITKTKLNGRSIYWCPQCQKQR